MSVITFAFFALGAILASFVGVVSARLHTGASIVRGRSLCDACGVDLPPIMLVPIVSYLLSGGRARCCGTLLSYYSPLTEVILGGLFVLSYFTLGFGIPLVLLLLALCLLLALVLYDLAHQIIPPVLLYPFVLIGLVERYLLSFTHQEFLIACALALGIAFFFFALHILSRGRAMGFADAPLALGLAFLVGSEYALTGLAFSFWVGALVGITILLRRPAGARMGVEVPFAPFLAVGFLLAYFVIPWNPFALLLLIAA